MTGTVRRYGFAMFATGAAIAARAALALLVEPPPFVTFYPAILASGWVGGRGPSLLSVLLSGVASGSFWVGSSVGGGLTWNEALGLALFVAVGTILAFMSAAFRQAHDEAESAHRKLERFFSSTGDAFMVFDFEWRYVFVNRRAAQFARMAPEQMIGRSLLELFPDIRSVPFFSAAEKVMRERVPASVESYYPPLDTWFENDIYPFDEGIGVFYRDVTERRRAADVQMDLLRREQAARSEAVAANRVKDEFLATLSHELRTPLNAIAGWASLLARGRLGPLATARAVDIIRRNVQAQLHLVEDLLDVSRITSGKLRLEMRPVPLGPVLEQAVETVRPAAIARAVRLDVVVEDGAAVVDGDPARLQQVAWNLLSNAIKFTPQGGAVTVSLVRGDLEARIEVRDTGIGIPAHMLHRIFDRFEQVDSTSRREYHGLGLGLALVRHLVEAHGGSVSASSDGEGQGSVFTVVLPLHVDRVERYAVQSRGTETPPST